MILTREQALKLHHEMWTDMQIKLGDCPTTRARIHFKNEWCKEHFPNEIINNNCFLCEYFANKGQTCASNNIGRCICLIDWGLNNDNNNSGCIWGLINYEQSPISEILALPERNTND
jgi:hypothetical protein